eukprot:c21600_g1_i5 orf=357-704(+)
MSKLEAVGKSSTEQLLFRHRLACFPEAANKSLIAAFQKTSIEESRVSRETFLYGQDANKHQKRQEPCVPSDSAGLQRAPIPYLQHTSGDLDNRKIKKSSLERPRGKARNNTKQNK